LGLQLALLLRAVRARGGLKLIGPLFAYDLSRLARRGRTTLLRCTYALLLLGWLSWVYLDRFPQYATLDEAFTAQPHLSPPQRSQFAQSIAIALLTLQGAAVLVLTPAYLAGAVAEEKEQKTLPLLLTTDLRDREIVFGKLLGRLFHLACILLTALPILCLTRLWGGVDGALLFGGVAVTALHLLSIGGISFVCSVLCRTVLAAIVISYLVVFVLEISCLLVVPSTSPVLFVSEFDTRLSAAFEEWQELVRSSRPLAGPGAALAGPPVVIPPPNGTLLVLEMLAPCAFVHGAIFLF